MSLENNSANNFKDFLDAIKPYLNYQFYDLSGQGVEANNFSTDEKVIGTWTDGKPLYQKVLTGNTKNEVGWKAYDTGIGAGVIDKVAYMNGCVAYSNGWTTSIGSTATGSHIMFDIKPATGEWEVYVGDNGAGFNCPAILILRYTKTTDTAVASGEKIVGQWIDGKPVYEKTWSFGSKVSISNVNWTDTPISSSGIERIVYACGYNLGTTNDKGFYPLNAMNENSYVQCLSCRDGSNAPCAYITLRYTKTA